MYILEYSHKNNIILSRSKVRKIENICNIICDFARELRISLNNNLRRAGIFQNDAERIMDRIKMGDTS